MFTVGYIAYICNIKLDDSFILRQFFSERYESLKKGLTEVVTVPGMPPGFKVYEKEAIIGIVHIKIYRILYMGSLPDLIILYKLFTWSISLTLKNVQSRYCTYDASSNFDSKNTRHGINFPKICRMGRIKSKENKTITIWMCYILYLCQFMRLLRHVGIHEM